jgi:hypothetical protein
MSRKATLPYYTELSPARILIKSELRNLKLGTNRFGTERDDIPSLYWRGPRGDEGFTHKYKGP